MKRSGSRLGGGAEFDLIERFLARAPAGARADVRVGPGDDCAVVRGEGIALSADMFVEGVHFRREWLTPEEIGYRAAAGAFSDLAAVAARPIGVLVSLALPERDAGDMAVRLMDGVGEVAELVGATLLGGDVTRSPEGVVVDCTVVGEARRPVLRSGAAPGDSLWVTGRLGGAAHAVRSLLRGEEPHPAARERFARPVPRTREALWLEERGVLRAAVDLSDGLAGDVSHVAVASGVAALLDRGSIPVHSALASEGADEALRLAVSGGEDYELLFAAAEGAVERHREAFAGELGVPLTRVGRVVAGEGVFWEVEGERHPVGAGGFQHFGDGR